MTQLHHLSTIYKNKNSFFILDLFQSTEKRYFKLQHYGRTSQTIETTGLLFFDVKFDYIAY
jgi:hypothetical protein